MELKKTDNLYIDCLSFGIKNMPHGISYNQLETHLNGLGWTIASNQEEYFRYWFFSHFYYEHTYPAIKNGNFLQVHQVIKDSKQWLDCTCPMTADAYETYLDHMKLERAKEDSKRSFNIGIAAIVISAALALIQIILQLCNGD
jgi:hypothetical protein